MSDAIVKIGNSVIQHGENNDRIYLMKLCKDEASELIIELNQLAYKYKYTKIFAKVPYSCMKLFTDYGYATEAHIPDFYSGKEAGVFMAKYFFAERKNDKKIEEIKKNLEISFEKAGTTQDINLKEGFCFRRANQEDSCQCADLYKKVFKTYPFPIQDPNYIKQTMDENTEYFGIWKDNEIIALSSSEKDLENKNTEMTDFAVLPEYRGNGFANFLLKEMELSAKTQSIETSYTIARALSFGMNICFAKSGYSFAGTLINNTNICGNLESMNVWYKPI